MLQPTFKTFTLGLCALCCLAANTLAAAPPPRPNIVLIMTDNHGAWTLGCYGNSDIRTPNIDRLAKTGTLFTRAFASNPVCSPTRATFLTGLMPSQHGVHCFLRGGNLQVGPKARNCLGEFVSIPEILRDEGYRCGLVGKWHLGDNLRPQEGLDDYWVTMPHGATSTFYGAAIIEDGKIRNEPKYLTDFWTEHAVRFIDQHANAEQPFFLFLAYNGPYSLGRLLLREGRNRHASFYADKQLPSFPREPTHPWQFSNRDYINNPVSIRRLATEVSGVDDGVGLILKTLSEHQIDRETLVIFVADQGALGGHGGFWGMGDHTRPLTARDGMMQIPMIWSHPDQIAGGVRSDIMVSNYDLLPTLLGYLGLGHRQPAAKLPGRDFSQLLTSGAPIDDWKNEVFYEFEDLRCLRTSRWKYVERHPNGPNELYDLQFDPKEERNLSEDSAHSATTAGLRSRLAGFFANYASAKYDLWNGGESQTAIFHGISQPVAEVVATPPPPTSEGFRAAEIALPEGFTSELAAGPPLVEHPMMGCFDEKGRLYLAESAGKNLAAAELEKQLPNYIRRLEDRDGDGKFDRATIFADKMTLPQGALWHQGALYVASPPNIWRLEDKDDDGVAESREILVSKFGYTGNGASVHGCFLGPDGRIYWCDGRHGHDITDSAGQLTSSRKGAYVFSCEPDGSDVRIHCGGGMDNPVEIDFTDEGDVLGTVNILYTRPRKDCLVHWLYGGTYPHSERVLGEFEKTGALLGPIHNFGHVAVSGMTRYRSGVLDRSFRDNIFVTIFNTGKVERIQLRRAGATFRAEPRDFLSCRSPDFHPTDILEDADGSLLVIDTGGWFLKGCPTSQTAKPDIKGAIYRIKRRGMTPLTDPWGKQLAWRTMPHNRLGQLLNDTRFKVRERAVQECSERTGILPTLRIALRRDSRQRRNAVWALARLASSLARTESSRVATAAAGTKGSTLLFEARELIRNALKDSSDSVRMAACNAFANQPYAAATKDLVALLDDSNAAVRRVAAKAVGRLREPQAVPALLAALSKRPDRPEEHALMYALLEIREPQSVARGIESDNPAVQRGALIALAQIAPETLTAESVAGLLQSEDQALRESALEIFCARKQWRADAHALLADRLYSPDPPAHVVRDLAAAFLEHQPIRALIGRVLNKPETSESTRWSLIDALAQGESVEFEPGWKKPLEKLLSERPRGKLERLIAAIASLKTDTFDNRLQAIVADPELGDIARIAALQALTARAVAVKSELFTSLVELLEGDIAPASRRRLAELVGGVSFSGDQLVTLSEFLEQAGPLELRALVQPFKRNQQKEVAAAFLRSIANARSLYSLPVAELSDVIKRYPQDLLPEANAILDRLKQQDQQKEQKIADLLQTIDSGDPVRGAELFASDKAKCSACHRVSDSGKQIGPDLSKIGSIRNSRDLLEAILFPSISFVREYEPFTVVTVAGRVHTGLIASETDTSLKLITQTGTSVVVPREEIDNVVPSTVSIMPNGLDKILSPQQLADLVAYLSGLGRQ